MSRRPSFSGPFSVSTRIGRQPGRRRLAEDGHDERLPEPPLALPRTLAVLQRDGASRPGDSETDVRGGAGLDELAARDLEQADERAQLEQALRRLPDHQRVPLVLFHFENISYQAIADLLGVSLGKVKTDIHRGREALRTLTTSHVPR